MDFLYIQGSVTKSVNVTFLFRLEGFSLNDTDWINRLKEQRTQYGVSQNQLAVMAGVSREYVSRLESGKVALTEEIKVKFTDALEKLNPENPLEMVLDYVRIRFPTQDVKVIGRTVKNYNKELARRAKHEISFCEIPELELNQLGVSDEYPIEFTSFDVFGTEVRVYDEKLCEAIKKLSERRRNVVLMFYFLELPDAEIAEILDISRNSVYRNRMCSLKLIRDMYEEELL